MATAIEGQNVHQTPKVTVQYKIERDSLGLGFHVDEHFGMCYDGCDNLFVLEATILVDGVEAGSAEVSLIDRGARGYAFHDAADVYDQDLYDTAVAVCTSRGFPRHASIRKADGQAFRGVFVYVGKLSMERRFRGDGTVVAMAVRALLEGETLRGRWTLAVYIPDGAELLSKEDLSRLKFGNEKGQALIDLGFNTLLFRTLLKLRVSGTFLSHEIAKAIVPYIMGGEEWMENMDARGFLRAGFQQVPELVNRADCAYLFAVRQFLAGPLKSLAEVNRTPIVRRKDKVDEEEDESDSYSDCDDESLVDADGSYDSESFEADAGEAL
eukprot:TRINITY_DN28709_c0_g1_i1.p1 TRINITY_DN28709_c0_g1~~TRINITY_DN28709_c0_g1_i1.p1  ORF type:complete len:341 (+),score=59.32 TRINITY_DN28709_c0_g1_i1:50-1024(+)